MKRRPDTQIPAPPSADTPESRLRHALPQLTRAERQLAMHMLTHYPVGILGPVAAIARAAGVSAPTVIRLVQKLGYSGYPEFQERLHAELGERLANPLARRARWEQTASNAPFPDRFTTTVIDNLAKTFERIEQHSLAQAAALVADPSRRIALIGGRLTQPLADYLAAGLQSIRPHVTLLPARPGLWPQVLLDFGAGDVLVAFDIRRYETLVGQVVEQAAELGLEIVLITDRWLSPAAAHARHIFACEIAVPSAWDSLAAPLFVAELLLAEVQAQGWPRAEQRLKRLEEIHNRMPFFRRAR